MPIFRTQIHQRLTGAGSPPESWTNTFHFDALGPNTALDAASLAADTLMIQSIAEVEVYLLTAQEVGGGDVARRAYQSSGQRSGLAANLIPMFNTVRMTLTDDVGRNQQHYLRGYILEINVQGYQISGELRTDIQEDVANVIIGILGFCGPNGENITGAIVQQVIQMRQTGWHRRTRPGFKRGWVPV